MENFWTSNIPINGLRHFVLVNQTKERAQTVFLMVSVLDSEVNMKISYEELVNSGNWQKGWLDLPREKVITEDYLKYKSIKKEHVVNKVVINHDSLFNIS
tara:strand:+ start:170 stop:469 length:300 start_codon:yes stop_codon:yes gene_type:complete